jgi:hypothetical protein
VLCETGMLLSFVLLCTVCILTERLFDDSPDNRVITPLVGFVLTVLVCARFAHASPGVLESPLHVVHVLLYIACFFYIRAMLDCLFRHFFFYSE